MSHIAKIRFNSVGKNEGCTCDRCGQYIRNIWTVEYKEGFKVNYGIDCWEKVYKAGQLNKYGEKEMRKIMKSIKGYEEMLAMFVSGEINEENDSGWKYSQTEKRDAWYGKPYEEYKNWMINEFFPYRISIEQERLKKFSKIDFAD